MNDDLEQFRNMTSEEWNEYWGGVPRTVSIEEFDVLITLGNERLDQILTVEGKMWHEFIFDNYSSGAIGHEHAIICKICGSIVGIEQLDEDCLFHHFRDEHDIRKFVKVYNWFSKFLSNLSPSSTSTSFMLGVSMWQFYPSISQEESNAVLDYWMTDNLEKDNIVKTEYLGNEEYKTTLGRRIALLNMPPDTEVQEFVHSIDHIVERLGL